MNSNLDVNLPLNIMSVDVEDYHDQLALDFQDRIIPPDREAVRCMERMLELFAEFGVKTTCFILGEIAEYFPGLVRRIADEGHHLGIHGYYHHEVYRLGPDGFRSAVDRAKKLVEDVAGREANAHRATAFSINEKSGTTWAMDILAELGFKYDSSVFPFRGRRYGSPEAPRQPYHHKTSHGPLWEIPMSTIRRGGRRLPVCGGGYLRLFPLGWTDRAVRQLNAEGLGAVVYLHPYEVETRPMIQPLQGLSFKRKAHFHLLNFQQVRRRGTTLPKLRHLMTRYRFGTVEQAVKELEASGYHPPEWSFPPVLTTTGPAPYSHE
jgi:polysaccharide deacetylase family protein (PEP-CTERM system associated)